MEFTEILEFWFKECSPKQWWNKDLEFDLNVKNRFRDVYEAAHLGALWSWRQTGHGRLAELIVLDQFPRNMFRDTPRAFESDLMAVALAQEAYLADIGRDWDDDNHRQFLLMPLMHSENKAVHRLAVEAFEAYRLPDNLAFELKHKTIIDRFGRYPHRNAILGRDSTDEEIAFLKEPGSRF